MSDTPNFVPLGSNGTPDYSSVGLSSLTAPAGTSGIPVSPTASTTPPVMTSTGLSSITKPAVVPQTPSNSTASTALQGNIGSATTPPAPDSSAALIAAKNSAQGEAQDSLKALIAELSNKNSTATATAEAYAANNNGSSVYGDQNKVTQAQAAIDSEKLALANKIDTIKKNASGSFGGNVDQEVQRESDASLSRQANMSVILSAAKGDYDMAKQIADASVAATTQAEENKITALQTIYTANKDLFSTAQQEEFTAAQAQRTSDLEDKRTQQTAINDMAITALKNGAPASVAQRIQNSGSLVEAEGHAGGYLVTPKTETTGSGFSGIATLLGTNPKTGKGYTTNAADPNAPAITDVNGKITPEGWTAIVNAAAADKITPDDLLAEYHKYLDPHSAAAYGLTPKQQTDYGIDDTKPKKGLFGF